ncbi:FtsQ-type POTRA domain-containing protein [Thiohalocapsa marina]|uniref:Cell division protein FtsQ n=1 Tax=Thiohalocapsa marina TaxID=424902 RepID=A0A5M8FRZ4_9GAMM|nr:cell division protein FtsQ/DivIB [Thiohalocapsa marina]KAA6186621.1 FtsQ-type POTRA domain-containing protein [Thiohalocapsa marina]
MPLSSVAMRGLPELLPESAGAESLPGRWALLARLVTAVVLLGTLASAGFIAWQWEPRLLPIRGVKVEGTMRGLSRESLQQTIVDNISGGILTQDLQALRDQVRDLPWIEQASVRRVWPDRIVFTVREHEAMARWGENGLVTADGVVFRPRDGLLPAGLPRLDGADQMAPEVVRRFQRWHGRLAELGLIIDSLTRDARGDWSIELLGGTELYLGTDDLEARFERLLAAYPQVEAIGMPIRIDLRYSNGFAVRWLPRANVGVGSERMASITIRTRS